MPHKDDISNLIRHTDTMLIIALTHLQNTVLLEHYSFCLLIVSRLNSSLSYLQEEF